MTEPTPPALTDAARFQTDCAVGENLTQQLAAAKEEIARLNGQLAYALDALGKTGRKADALRAQLAREPSAVTVDEAMIDRARVAAVNEWKAMSRELDLRPDEAARSFVSPGNYRLLRAALVAALTPDHPHRTGEGE